ncbi:MAG: SDR family NAD(P)-dependent oxidoreductase [Sphingobacteriia bacterium]|nr:SDR family NAD(P)-dependent oxidoreductase [Sphingobacteriia bacterium]NCC40869.1 SDR family NAD(P)-dependent oxidoreductase [Gammaproteobacteria bacterium]
MQSIFPQGFSALVVGATGAIGGAWVRHLQQDPACSEVVGVARATGGGFDLEDESSIERLGRALADRGPFHLIIDATGALTIAGRGPEKSLAMLDGEALRRSFAVNTIGPALLLRSLAPLLAKGDAVYAKLSARVGSISDNRRGGWYGYRASKAAMNMVLQTAAIELQRRNPRVRVVALQPGTVRSRLSQPFARGVEHLLEPEESVAGLMQALGALPSKSGAHFIDYQGQEIPW